MPVGVSLLVLPMRASRLGVQIGCALSAWTPVAGFVRSLGSSADVRSSVAKASAAVGDLSWRPRGVSGGAIASAGWRVGGTSAKGQLTSRARYGRQPRVFMSSNQGMNPETFTERAWDAMVRLPALADANNAQVKIDAVPASYSV